jgi:hypothetical protein
MSGSLNAMFAELRGLADRWERDAKTRRHYTAADSVSDTLDPCASELRTQVEALAGGTKSTQRRIIVLISRLLGGSLPRRPPCNGQGVGDELVQT